MKRIVSMMVAVCLVLLLTACFPEEPFPTETQLQPTNSPAPVQTQPATEVTTPPTTMPEQQPYPYPMAAVSLPLFSDSRKADDGRQIFSYTYQTMTLTVPEPSVGSSVTSDHLNRIVSASSAAEKVEQAALAAYTGQSGWTPYFYRNTYTPTRLDQTVLSFFVSKTFYDGAQHSSIVAQGLTYDLIHGTPLALREILLLNYDSAQLCNLICTYFDDAQTNNFYPDYEAVIEDMFSTNIPVEDWYFTQEGLCFFFNPGEIAPYSEEIPVSTIPYSELVGILQDIYFPPETVEFHGTPRMSTLADGTVPAFEQFAEVIIDTQAPHYCLSVDGTIQNVRILYGTWNQDGSFAANATIFAAQALTDGTAAILQCPEKMIDMLCIEFDSGSSHYTVPATQLLS